ASGLQHFQRIAHMRSCRLLHGARQLFKALLCNRRQHTFLVREMPVRRSMAHADGASELAQAECACAMGCDLRNCRFDQHILEVAVMVVAGGRLSGLRLHVVAPETPKCCQRSHSMSTMYPLVTLRREPEPHMKINAVFASLATCVMLASCSY